MFKTFSFRESFTRTFGELSLLQSKTCIGDLIGERDLSEVRLTCSGVDYFDERDLSDVFLTCSGVYIGERDLFVERCLFEDRILVVEVDACNELIEADRL